MNLGIAAPGILFGIAALIALLFFARFLLRRAFPNGWRGHLEAKKLEQKRTLLRTARELMEEDSYNESFIPLRNSFLLEAASCKSLINEIHDHNLTVLETLITLSRNHPVRLPNVPTVEELLQNRWNLLLAHSEARENSALAEAQRKRSEKIPEWAAEEFSRKITELEERVATNRKSLEAEISKLFRNLGELSETTEVTYH